MEEIAQNAETYKTQIFKLLDPEKTVTRFNSEWLEPLGSFGWVKLAAKYNVAQMLERRDFKKRYEAGQPIAIHEFMYSLAQAYDSVFLEADVEMGGTDQLFNLNVGRDIMPAFDLEPQVVMTTPLLEGLDGVEKMSKSLGNYVGITEAPSEMFGKLMSISDDLMWRYYTLLTDQTPGQIEGLRARVSSGELHPKQAKVNLAKAIVRDFHGEHEVAPAADAFERRFARGEIDAGSLETITIAAPAEGVMLARIIAEAGLAGSNSDASRKIQQGGVKVDREKVNDIKTRYPAGAAFVLEVGRRAVRVAVTAASA
jgi:tyrosyl-tRNA synthetase